MNQPTLAIVPDYAPAADSIEEDSVRQEMKHILASPGFASSAKLSSFLEYIVNETLSGNARDIKAYSIAINAFKRPSTFDPQADPIVRIQAGRMRRAMEQYYQTAEHSSPLRIVVAKGSYIPVFVPNAPPLMHPFDRTSKHKERN
tara:strand:+ start:781 stop:1215 length:435 start_codon:yes stop_codon:yes gene_type:complete